VSELEASRMILVNKPLKVAQEVGIGTPVYLELKGICMTLGMSKPPANIAMFQFFSGIEKKASHSCVSCPCLIMVEGRQGSRDSNVLILESG